MRVILLGPPGVGKGTTAKALAEKFAVPHIGTGDVLRAEIASNSKLGKQAKEYVESGRLVPDDLVTEMVKEKLSAPEASKGYFLDGYPRTLPQAKALKEFAKIDYVLNLSAPKKVIIDRISGRGEGRSDDTPDIIMKRISVYEAQTKPLTDFYRNEGLLVEIDSTKDVNGVLAQCVEVLKK